MRVRKPGRVAALAAWIVIATSSSYAYAERMHVVAKGHTLGKIAKRYHVSIEVLADVNGLTASSTIRPGLELVIPDEGREAQAKARAAELRSRREDAAEERRARARDIAEAEKYAKKPARPGRVTFKSGSGETSVVLVEAGQVRDAGLEALRSILRHRGGAEHDIDPKLARLIARVSDHFGGRPLRVMSGYRPASAGSHSNHHEGRAIDFRIEGVPNRVVRDFCLGLDQAGVGYYPNSTFVHLDSRSVSFAWIDHSGPGEPPRYEAMTTHLARDGRSKKTSSNQSQHVDKKAGNNSTSDLVATKATKKGRSRPPQAGQSAGPERRSTVGKRSPD